MIPFKYVALTVLTLISNDDMSEDAKKKSNGCYH